MNRGTLRVATWNTNWATARTDRGQRIASIINAADADIVVLTEGTRDLLPASGFVIDAGADWGYHSPPQRRKVIIWSRLPLTPLAVPKDGAARGRLAAAMAATPDGPVRILGVCIPWKDAHVHTGRADTRPWAEHLEYLDQLEPLISAFDDDLPTVIAGDYNQRVPRGRQPVAVADRLREVFAGWTIHTAGALPHGPHIDHIATDRRLVLDSIRDWPAFDDIGRLSDHTGVVCRLTVAGPSVAVNPTEADAALAPPITELTSAALPQPIPHTERVPRKNPTAIADSTPQSDGSLDPELRAEIKNILRRSGEGLSHGATFRLREQGFSDAEIAEARGVGVSATRVYLRSLKALFAGTLPTSMSAALDNSYVYRELLNHALSDDLASYTRAQLRKLKDINPQVSFDPLKTRRYQYGGGKRKTLKPVGDVCPDCGLNHAGEC